MTIKADEPRRHFLRARVLLAVAATVGALLVALSVPVWAGSTDVQASADAPACGAVAAPLTYHFGENPLESTAPCAAGPKVAQSRWEAMLAGAGLLTFGGAALLYRRRVARRPASIGQRA